MDADKDFEEFVDLLLNALGEHVESHEMRRTENGSLLKVRGCQVNLRSLFRTYVAAPEQGVTNLVAMVLATIERSESSDSTPAWENAKERLRPKVWDRMMMVSNEVGMPFKLVGEHLMLSLVLDDTHSMQTVPREYLDIWGITFDEGLRIAFENITGTSQLMGVTAEDGSSGHCSTATHDCYDSVRFLIEMPYETFKIGYPRFAFPSARDMCVMCMADRLNDVEFNIDMAFEFGDADPKPLPPFPLVNDGEGWRNWQPPPGSKLERKLARRQFAHMFNGYSNQTRELQETLPEQGDFVRVESFQKWPGSTDKLPKSYTNWPIDTECLLPKADYIVFPDRDNLRVAWADVIKVCSSQLMPAEAVYPERWRTDGNPTDDQFDRLESMSL